MSKPKRIIRRMLFAAALVAVLIGINRALDYAVKVGLEKGFAAGTGCLVSVEDADFHFFPLGATLRNAYIRHPSEPPEHGFRAEYGAVEVVSLAELFSKTVRLGNFQLTGVSAVSIGADTAFLKTIGFIVGDHPPDPQRKPHWHDFISHDWKVRLRDLTITAKPSTTAQLTIGNDTFTYRWHNVVFRVENDPDPDVPTILQGSADGFALQFKDTPPLSLGALQAKLDVLRGVLRIHDASLVYQEPGSPNRSETTVTGELHVRELDVYRLEAKSKVYSDYLAHLLPEQGAMLQAVEPVVELSTSVSGALLDPAFHGHLVGTATKQLPLFRRDACTIDRIEGDIAANVDHITLSNVRIADITHDALFELAFNSAMNFRGALRLSLSQDNPFVQRCLEPSDQEARSWISATLEEAVTDSVTDLELSGTLQPLVLDAKVRSETQRSVRATRSTLSAQIHLAEGQLKATVVEHGVVAQIQQEARRRVPALQTSQFTPFETALNSNIKGELLFDLTTGALELPQLEIVRYPAKQLIARAAPFISDEVFHRLSEVTTDLSLVDATLKLRRLPTEPLPAGEGKVTVTQLSLGGFPIERAVFPVAFGNERVTIKPLRLETAGGEIVGEVSVAEGGALRAALNTQELRLNEIPAVSNVAHASQIALSGGITMGGTAAQPEIAGAFEVLSRIYDDSPEQRSTVRLSSNADRVSLVAELMDAHASIELHYPRSHVPNGRMTLTGRADDFPLDIFLEPVEPSPGEITPRSEAMGTVSAQLEYSGPKDRPLAGEGSLVVSRLEVVRGEATITHPRPLRAAINEGRLVFSDVVLVAGGRELALRGSVSETDGWQATIDGSWELTHLVPELTAIEQVSGTVTLAIAIEGDVGAPLFDGTLVLRDGAVSFPMGGTIVGATDIFADAELHGSSLTLHRASAALGDGKIEASGEVDEVLDERYRSIALDFTLTDVFVEPIENFAIEADGVLQLTAEGGTPPLLGGTIVVTNASYEDRIDLRDVLATLTRTIAGVRSVETTGTGGGRADLLLNLSVQADNSIIVETNVMEGELRSNLHVGGSIRQPIIGGAIEVIEGSFGVQSRKFEIISGKVTFPEQRGNIDPALNIIGETQLRRTSGEEYHVIISITGTITRPRVQFSSDSGLTEKDIVSLLFFGGRIEELSLLQVSPDTSRTSYGELLNPRSELSFTERLTGLASFSDISIDTLSPLSTTHLVPVITASRPIVSDVDLILRTELGSDQRSSASISYSVTPFLALISTWSNRSVTEPDSGSSTAGVGVRYRRSFPGLNLLPRLGGED